MVSSAVAVTVAVAAVRTACTAVHAVTVAGRGEASVGIVSSAAAAKDHDDENYPDTVVVTVH